MVEFLHKSMIRFGRHAARSGHSEQRFNGTQRKRRAAPLSSDIRLTKTAAALRTSIKGDRRIPTPFALRVAQYCKPCEAMARQFSEEVLLAPRTLHSLGKSTKHYEQRDYYRRHPRVRHNGGVFQIDLLERDNHKNRDSGPFNSIAGSGLTLKMFTYRHVPRLAIWPVRILLLATAGVQRMAGAPQRVRPPFLEEAT